MKYAHFCIGFHGDDPEGVPLGLDTIVSGRDWHAIWYSILSRLDALGGYIVSPRGRSYIRNEGEPTPSFTSNLAWELYQKGDDLFQFTGLTVEIFPCDSRGVNLHSN